MNLLKKFKVSIIIVSIGIFSFTSYSFVDNYFEVSKNLDIFATLYREVNMYYVDETKPGELIQKGIDAMLESLDPYTNYIPESDRSGEYTFKIKVKSRLWILFFRIKKRICQTISDL